jgi:molybdate transport system substrate-binding protein
VVWIAVSLLAPRNSFAAESPLTISAAVSLKESFTQIGAAFEKQTGQKVEFNFGATGHLLAQIREGAPVDAFVSASDEQMDQAEKQGLVDPATRAVIAGNEMVLILPRDSNAELRTFDELAGAAVKKLAIGQPKVVPAGDYAVQVLHHLKLDTVVADRIVYGSSVRQVLDYVARGEVDAGIVYATDAQEARSEVKVIARSEPSWHDPIHYVAAVVKSSKRAAEAKRFIDFMRGDSAQKILATVGFTSPAPAPAPAPAAASTTQPATR